VSYKPTLLILAAGMGTRYGGLKQLDPVGPHGERILDYSMYDAVRAGFQKIVFVIRRDFEEAFRKTIGSKLDKNMEMAYVYQEPDSCLNGFPLPPDCPKPWGTGHAILVAREAIREPFAVINADDYYGRHAYGMMKEQLTRMSADRKNPDYAMAGYILRNTLSDYGSVARGVCQHDPDMYLVKVTERTKIKKNGDKAVFMDEEGVQQPLTGDEMVSMNLWGFAPDIFDFLRQQFAEYLRRHGSENKSEFYIPAVVDNLIQSRRKKVKILPTLDRWFGMTYPQDKVVAQSCIRTLIEQNIYPEKLWREGIENEP
jgi:dTDP-glucose pyrophosphorylase